MPLDDCRQVTHPSLGPSAAVVQITVNANTASRSRHYLHNATGSSARSGVALKPALDIRHRKGQLLRDVVPLGCLLNRISRPGESRDAR